MVHLPLKTVSFIIAGRNDNYLGNFKKRLQLSMNFLAHSAHQAGISHDLELLLVDWNSDTPLLNELNLSEECLKLTRVVEVSTETAERHKQHDEQNFHSTLSYNTGIRRANSKYVFIIPADTIIPHSALQNLYNLLMGQYVLPYSLEQVVFKISRKMIPYLKSPSFDYSVEELDLYLATCSSSFYLSTRPNITAGMASIGTSKEIWSESGAFDEKLGDWGFSDHEFGLRVEQLYHGLELSHYGILFYDLDQNVSSKQIVINRSSNREIYSDKLHVNTKNWGLNDEQGINDYFASEYPKDVLTQITEKSETKDTLLCNSLDEVLSFPPLSDLVKQYGNLISLIHNIFLDNTPTSIVEIGMTETLFSEIALSINNTLDLDCFFDLSFGRNEKSKYKSLTPFEIGTKLNKYFRHRGKLEFFNSEFHYNNKISKINNKAKVGLVLFQYDGMSFTDIPRNLLIAVSMLNTNGMIILIGKSSKFYSESLIHSDKLSLYNESFEEDNLKISVLSKTQIKLKK